jgi:hypothetical protein
MYAHIHAMEYCSAIKNEIMPLARKMDGMELEIIILS